MEKKNLLIGCGVIFVIGVIVVISLISSIVGVWNNLNSGNQEAKARKSNYSAALNTIPEMIKGSWTMSDQYLDHESSTFRDTAAARSGLLTALDKFKEMDKAGGGSAELTKQGKIVESLLSKFQQQSAISINAVAEQYPQLRGADTTMAAMRNLESGVNQIKTALDDWIVACKNYNDYRGGAWASIVGSFMSRFPSELAYYEGDVTKLDIGSLNPKAPIAPATPTPTPGK